MTVHKSKVYKDLFYWKEKKCWEKNWNFIKFFSIVWVYSRVKYVQAKQNICTFGLITDTGPWETEVRALCTFSCVARFYLNLFETQMDVNFQGGLYWKSGMLNQHHWSDTCLLATVLRTVHSVHTRSITLGSGQVQFLTCRCLILKGHQELYAIIFPKNIIKQQTVSTVQTL